MVRLKVRTCYNVFYPKCYFNSTMVRLKERSDIVARLVARFQFHYGTIKSISGLFAISQCAIFQFHYGTIKRTKQKPRR